jgi:hypothetical protein
MSLDTLSVVTKGEISTLKALSRRSKAQQNIPRVPNMMRASLHSKKQPIWYEPIRNKTRSAAHLDDGSTHSRGLSLRRSGISRRAKSGRRWRCSLEHSPACRRDRRRDRLGRTPEPASRTPASPLANYEREAVTTRIDPDFFNKYEYFALTRGDNGVLLITRHTDSKEGYVAPRNTAGSLAARCHRRVSGARVPQEQ